MNFICTKNNFLEALKLTEHAVGKNINLPILQNVLLRCEKNKLYCTSTDLELGISTWIFIKGIKDGQYSVPLKNLLVFIQNTPEDTLECSIEKDSFFIKTKTTSVHMKGEDASQFPLLPVVQKKEAVMVNFSSIPQILSSVISSLSPTTSKPELSGVYINGKEKNILCAASDGFRLAEKTTTLPHTNEEDVACILPNRTSQELIRIFGQNDVLGKLHGYIDTHQILIEHTSDNESTIPSFFIVSRLIEGEYPDYQQIIPDSWNTTVNIQKDLLFNHIKNAGFFSNKLCEVRVKFSPQLNTCTVSTEEHTQGSYTSTLSCEGKGDEQEILINYRYILDALQPVRDENVTIKIKQKDNPILIVSPKEQYISLIMPLRS